MHQETERLILRPWEARDRQPLRHILGDPIVRRFYPATATPEEVDAQIDNSILQAKRDGFHLQAVEFKSSGELVGLLGLARLTPLMQSFTKGEVEIGWQFDKRFWGQGLAPEAARVWLDYAWTVLRLPQVIAYTAVMNVPSQRVMEKIGMVKDPDGEFDHPKIEAGHPLRRHVVYRITNRAASGANPTTAIHEH